MAYYVPAENADAADPRMMDPRVADSRARFGFAYYDVAEPTARGLETARDPASGRLMHDLHHFFYRGDLSQRSELVSRLRAAEAGNPLLQRLDPRMSNIVSRYSSPQGSGLGAASAPKVDAERFVRDAIKATTPLAALGAGLGVVMGAALALEDVADAVKPGAPAKSRIRLAGRLAGSAMLGATALGGLTLLGYLAAPFPLPTIRYGAGPGAAPPDKG